MPKPRQSQGVSNRGRHAPFGKTVLYYKTHLAVGASGTRIRMYYAQPISPHSLSLAGKIL